MQLGLGNTLLTQAERTAGTAGLALLSAAADAYRAALAALDPTADAPTYARVQLGLGNTLSTQAQRTAGTAGLALLSAAADAYRAVLAALDPTADAPTYARVQLGLGNTLSTQAGGRLGQRGWRCSRRRRTPTAAPCSIAARCRSAPVGCDPEQQGGRAPRAGGTAGRRSGAGVARCRRWLLRQAACDVYPHAVQPDEHRQQARVLANALLQRALAPESAGDARAEAFDRAWAAISSALQAARDLALREALVSFRQKEWAQNARVFTLAATIIALRGAAAPQPATQRDRLAQAIALLEEGRARGLAEASGRRNADLAQLSQDDQKRYTQAVVAAQDIEAQSRQLGDPLALADEARAADERLKQVVREIRERQQAQGKDFLPEPDVSLSTLARGLGAGEALVYLMPLEVGTLLLATGPSGEPVMRWLGKLTSDAIFALAVQPNEAEINRCGYLPAALGWGETPLDQALDALLPQLGDDLMRVVTQVVRQLGCHRAVLVAGGFLSVMPLHAASYAPLLGEPASAPGGRRYACDDVAFTYAPSGLTLLAARAKARRQAQAGPARRALVVGNPQLTGKNEPWTPGSAYYLRFAEWEAQRVAALAGARIPPFAVDLEVNDAATWTAVDAGMRDADLAHLSLHARFDSANPDESALLVAYRAHLYLRDLLQVNLERLRLIVLSACQSGQSDVQNQSEEAIGLFGALLAAGTPAVVGTLWSVNDLATAHFMESFASRAYRDGVAPDAALRAAARELRGVGDDVAAPAETGASLREVWSVEEVVPGQPHATPAREAIAQDLTRQPELAGATRQMSALDWMRTAAQTANMRDLLSRGPEHPMYWAAFVYYGAPVSLAGGDADALPADVVVSQAATAPTAGAPATGGVSMANNDQRDDDKNGQQSDQGGEQDADDALPIAESRAASYFPAASEVCPRCHAEDYLPVRDARGRDLRQCASCGKLYAPNGSVGGDL